ncbi:MAG: hypothetical protein IPL95_03920 [Saprospiraceae bacterium]|nr:hypothetical protein [Saprospiraceae bacterium]
MPTGVKGSFILIENTTLFTATIVGLSNIQSANRNYFFMVISDGYWRMIAKVNLKKSQNYLQMDGDYWVHRFIDFKFSI